MLKLNDTHCNIEEMLRVRALISKLEPEQCDMRAWCGTAKCIGGWADCLDLDLGLTEYQGEALFFCDDDTLKSSDDLCHERRYAATKADMLTAIDNVIEDGMPHWQDIMKGRV